MPVHRRPLCAAACVALPMLCAGLRARGASAWPDKPLRLITPYPPAGLADQLTRFVAERISAPLGAPVIVDNRPGAGALLGTSVVSRLNCRLMAPLAGRSARRSDES